MKIRVGPMAVVNHRDPLIRDDEYINAQFVDIEYPQQISSRLRSTGHGYLVVNLGYTIDKDQYNEINNFRGQTQK